MQHLGNKVHQPGVLLIGLQRQHMQGMRRSGAGRGAVPAKEQDTLPTDEGFLQCSLTQLVTESYHHCCKPPGAGNEDTK